MFKEKRSVGDLAGCLVSLTWVLLAPCQEVNRAWIPSSWQVPMGIQGPRTRKQCSSLLSYQQNLPLKTKGV